MTRCKFRRKPAVLPAAKHSNPTIALVDEKNTEIAELKRKLNATRRKLRAANADVAAAARLAQANGIEEPFAFTDVVDQTIARLETTTAWKAVIVQRLLIAFGNTPLQAQKELHYSKPTLGRISTLIEKLVDDRDQANMFIAEIAKDICNSTAERQYISYTPPTEQHAHLRRQIFLARQERGVYQKASKIAQADRELIARLAYNLSEGDEQEQIAAATPEEQRQRVEERAFELAELSLLREMAASMREAVPSPPSEPSADVIDGEAIATLVCNAGNGKP